jgi:spore coat-associated protein N
MNKATKGAIAAGAAGILLLGGAGTFAVWSDSNTIDPADISTGVLTLVVEEGTWDDATVGSTGDIANIADFEIVPGDTITYTTVVTVNAEGDNLSGTLTVDDSELAATSTDPDTANYIEVSMTNDAAANLDLDVNETGVITFAEAGTYVINVVVTVEFDSATINQTGQHLAVDLNGLELKLEQKS